MNESNQQRAHRVALGSLICFAGNIINIFGRLILVPLFLRSWGTERYGEWLTLYAAVGYMSMLDLGIQSYVINKLNQCHSTERSDEYGHILHSALLVSVIICLIIVLLFVVIVPVLPLEKWFNFIHTDHSVVVLVTLLLAIQIVTRVPCGIISGLYRTFGEFPRGAMIANVRIVLVFLATGIVVASGGGFALLALIQLLPVALVVSFIFWDISRRHPEVQLGFREGNLKKGFSFLIPSSFFFLIRISTLTVSSGSTIIVATQLGPSTVAVFSTLRTLVNLTKQIPVTICNALWPELTSLEAKKQYEILRKIHFFLVKIGFSISLCLGMIIHFSGENIVNLWTNGRIIYNPGLLNVFLVYIVFQLTWSMSGMFQAAFNRPRILGILSTCSALGGLTLAYFLTPRFGAEGTVLGLLIAEIIFIGVIIPVKTCKILGQRSATFFYEIIIKGAPLIGIMYLSGLSIDKILLNSHPMVSIIGVGSVVMIISGILVYYVYLNQGERKNMVSILRGLWRKNNQNIFFQ